MSQLFFKILINILKEMGPVIQGLLSLIAITAFLAGLIFIQILATNMDRYEEVYRNESGRNRGGSSESLGE